MWYRYEIEDATRSFELDKFGNIRNADTHELIKGYYNMGYKVITYRLRSGKRKLLYIHKAVAELFIGIKPDDEILILKDHDKSNCVLSNLEYVSRIESNLHRLAIQVSPYDLNPRLVSRAKLTEAQVKLIRGYKTTSRTKLAKKFGTTYMVIWKIQTGRSYKRWD